MIQRVTLVVIVSCVLACGDQVGGFLHGHESSEVVEVSGDVVSRINGSAIGVTEVERLAQVGKLPPNAALERLQAERLLGQEASERGYARRSHTELVAREALVQELLVNVVEPVEVSQRELEQSYASQKSRFTQPEKRRATHVLAQVASSAGPDAQAAAQAFIKQTIRALQGSKDAQPTLEMAKGESSPHFRVQVQDLPLAANDGTFVPEFSRALFSLDATGVVPEPVHTEFGYHAILLTEIVPALDEPQSVAFETIRQEIVTRKRTQQLQELLSDLRKRTRVKFADDTQKILATLDL
ncbi:MAG TPA: peptidylprolyl isomerase [Polyangiales bacterium]|nr:peptidylprolyl isomerase [Polyangiales bacterium]